jgi:hypothetical protein
MEREIALVAKPQNRVGALRSGAKRRQHNGQPQSCPVSHVTSPPSIGVEFVRQAAADGYRKRPLTARRRIGTRETKRSTEIMNDA